MNQSEMMEIQNIYSKLENIRLNISNLKKDLTLQEDRFKIQLNKLTSMFCLMEKIDKEDSKYFQ